MSAFDIVCTIIAFFLPPLAVFMKRGLHSQFWLNICLTIFGWIPGVIHALVVVFKYRQHRHWPPPAAPLGAGPAGPVVP